MRVLAALFFLFNVPLVVFFGTILYGGVSGTALKQDLVQANIYQTLTDKIKDSIANTDTNNSDDTTVLIAPLIEHRLTPSYLQGKTEQFIDDTGEWIQGKTQTPPVVSFKEIKDDILAQNPNLISDLEKGMDEVKKQQAEQAASSPDTSSSETTDSVNKQLNFMHTLITSDFSIPMGKYLTGLKQTYQVLHIALPVLAVLLLLSIILIILLSKTITAKLRWLGIVLLLSAGYGFLITMANGILLSTSENVILGNHNAVVTTVSPIAISMMTLFVDQYKHYQTTTNIIFLMVAGVSLILSFVIKPQTTTPALAKKATTTPKKK